MIDENKILTLPRIYVTLYVRIGASPDHKKRAMKIRNPQLFTKPLLQLLFTDTKKRRVRWAKGSRKDFAQQLFETAIRWKTPQHLVAVAMIELHYGIYRLAFRRDDMYDVDLGRTNKEFVEYIQPFYEEAFGLLLKDKGELTVSDVTALLGDDTDSSVEDSSAPTDTEKPTAVEPLDLFSGNPIP